MARWAAALKSVLPGRSGGKGTRARSDSDRNDTRTASGTSDEDVSHSYAPVVWLLGKVQSGKTSIIRTITASTDAEIGDGFRPCTRTARLYAFPSEMPVLRFLDTRGLGETGYDPAEDLAFAEGSSHLIVATMRAMDPDQDAVLDALHQVRRRHLEWPIVVAQTSLHEGYPPGHGHTRPYPFEPHAPPDAIARIPIDLMRALAHQRSVLDKLPGRGALLFVPVDLTRPDDGLPPADYGLDALAEALATVAPARMLAALASLPGFTSDPLSRSADPIVMGHAMAAAGGDLVPLPVAGAIAASTIQARMLSRLGRLYGVTWDKRAYAELTAALGAGTVAKVAAGVGIRQLAKFLPVYGQTAGAAASAAASFAVTYALGKAAVYYLHGRRLGTADRGGIAQVYEQALRDAFRMARERTAGEERKTTQP
ncbi:YcjF family protein [Hyphomicrobium sp.]|uniref:YcjF family protein n=1 Tax=Hyphomicrobium sp. TaxID=82 RepID=UPI002FDEE651